MKKLILLLIAPFALLLVTGQEAEAQLGLDFGPEVSYNTETENLGVGARLQVSPIAVPVGFSADGQYVFCDETVGGVDVPCSGWEFGATAKWEISLPGAPVAPYIGAGLTHMRSTFEIPGVDDTDSDTGLHVAGGIGIGGLFPLGMFLEGRFAFMEENQLGIRAGILF